MSKHLPGLVLLACASLPIASVQAAVPLQSLSDTEFAFGGYVKADLMLSDYSEGAPGDNSPSRQFYAPGFIYGDGSNRGSRVSDFQARESRLNFSATNELDGHKLKLFMEMDFLLHVDGNEMLSNSFSPRLRHAFLSVDNWLFGQTWTTLLNTAAIPEALDFTGAAEGTVFVRQSMLRYSEGSWQFALENSNSNFTDAQDGKHLSGSSDLLPDLIARYNFGNSHGKFTLAALMRQLKYDENGVDERAFGWALTGSGVIPVGSGKDKIKFMVNYGDGAGRYLALCFVSGAVLDNGKADTIKTTSGFATYQHWWNDKWRSNITLSAFESDYDTLPAAPVNDSAYSGNLNLLYSPVKPITLGIEYLYANNKRTDGFDAELNRLTFSIKYAL